MKNKKKVLVIPGAFVPVNDTVTLLSYKHLRNIDAEFDVIALSGKNDQSLIDELTKDSKFSKFNIEYFCAYSDAIANFQRKNVISAWIQFHKYARYALKKALHGNYDFVYTSSVPVFTHLAGYYIKRKLKKSITWIASFSDPIYKSPYKYDTESIKEYSLIEKIGFYIYIHLFMNDNYEKLAQKYADKVIYIDQEQRDFTLQQYNCKSELLNKSMIIPLNYIEEWKLYQNMNINSTCRDFPLKYYHFGRIYGLRKIDKFLYAVYNLKKTNENLSSLIQFHQYGEVIPRYQKLIEELNLQDCFILHEKTSYQVSMDLMKKSDGLLLFDTIMPDNQIQPYLPSKSLEYLLLKKPLIIITTERSPAFQLFQKYNYHCCESNQNDILAEIQKHIRLKNVFYDYDVSEYENKVATLELKKYIEEKEI